MLKIKSVVFLVIAFSIFSVQKVFAANTTGQRGFQKVIWIVLENTNVKDALKQPFFAELNQRGALMAKMQGERHPSQANYISMIAGDGMGVFLDFNVNINGNHLGDLLESHGRTWKAYAEGYPGNCFLGAKSGTYVRKHVPFISFKNVSTDAVRCANIVNSAQFDKDLLSNSLPDYSMYVPDMNNDGHNTNVEFAAKYMEKKFGGLLRDPEFLQDKLFVVTFDESETYFGNSIYTVLVGANVIPGAVNQQKVNHISLLRMIEDEWALGSLNRDDRHAKIVDGIWR
jgi:acid phosphatase